MHVHISDVLTVGGVSGAILAVFALIVALAKVVRAMFRLVKRAGKFFDQWFGDREAGMLSVPERMTQIADQVAQQGHRLDEHLTWHSAAERTNGGAPRRTAPTLRGSSPSTTREEPWSGT